MPRPVLAAALLAVISSLPVAASAAGAKPRVARKASLRTGLIMTHDDELVRAVKKKDRGALERLAERMGPGHLGEALHRSDPAVAEAALVALPLTRGAVLEMGAVTDLLESSNASLGASAARVLGQLLDGAEPGALDNWEVPPDMVERACNGLRGLATRSEAAVTARVAAISAVASASVVCPARQRRAGGAAARPGAGGSARDGPGAAPRGEAGQRRAARRGARSRAPGRVGGGGDPVPRRAGRRLEHGRPVQDRCAGERGGRAGARDGDVSRDAGRRRGRDARLSGARRPLPWTSRSWTSCAGDRRRRCAIARPSS